MKYQDSLMKGNTKDLKRNLRYSRKKGTKSKTKRGRGISKKFVRWLITLFPRKGQVFASREALNDKKFMDDTIPIQTPLELWENMEGCVEKRSESTNPVDKAIYKRLRRRLRNRYYDLKSNRAVFKEKK